VKFAKPLAFAFVFLILAAGAAGAFFNWEINRPAGAGEKTEVVVEPGESVKEIAGNLEEAGVVRWAEVFTFYVRLQKLSSNLQAGRYEILPSFSIVQIAELLQHGTFDVRLTFLEGWRREQHLAYALEMLSVGDEEFSAEFNRLTGDQEGYLFPDTYVVPVNISAKELVEIMIANFNERYAEVSAAAQGAGLTRDQVVTVASMLERETAGGDNQEEMRTIAGILIKRWKSGWLLGVDATVQYALGYDEETGKWWKVKLTTADLAVDSSYNTYKYRGLPAGPISSPGLAALSAAANYTENTPHWYYLHGTDGQVRYAETLEKHNENKAKYIE